jgi:hypothetical protein
MNVTPYYTAPSEKNLMESLKIERKEARQVREIIRCLNPFLYLDERESSFPQTTAWRHTCYNPPSRRELRLSMLDEILHGYGVEVIANKAGRVRVEYINMGDTYTATLIYVRGSRRFTVGDWGTLMESPRFKDCID